MSQKLAIKTTAQGVMEDSEQWQPSKRIFVVKVTGPPTFFLKQHLFSKLQRPFISTAESRK